MSELIVIGYDDEMTAEEVLDEFLRMERDYLVDLEDAAVVFRDTDGHLHVHTRHHSLGHETLTGMFWGLVVGLIFLVPLAGAAFGGLVGLVTGTVGDLGMKEDFKHDVGALVQPGKSALMAVIRKAAPDKMLEELSAYGGTVLRTSLTDDHEDKLAEALRETKAIAA